LCLTVTPLDPSTVHELSQLLLPMESPKISSNLTSSDNLLNLTTYSSKVNLSRREICKDHGEEVSYYCLDCQCRCICTECVVHGVHKTHEVLNVKRAYPHVFEKTEDLLQTVHHKIGEINNVQFSLDNKKRELCDNTNSLKNQLANIFEDIRAKLQKKEKEIFEKAELFLQEHLQELNTYSRVLQSRVLSLNKLVDGINSHMTRNDEVSLLNFYSENKDRIGQNIKADIPEIPDFDTIYNLKVNVNQNSLESLLNSLNTVHMEISSMKGFEINKIQATQKFALKRDLYGSKDNTSNLKMGNFSKNMNSLANVSNFTPQNSSYEYSKNNLV
jgi:hypothetical protein